MKEKHCEIMKISNINYSKFTLGTQNNALYTPSMLISYRFSMYLESESESSVYTKVALFIWHKKIM